MKLQNRQKKKLKLPVCSREYTHPSDPVLSLRFSRGGSFSARVPYGAGTSFNFNGRPKELFSGNHPLNYNTVYAMDLSNTTYIHEWDEDIRMREEEVVAFTENGLIFLDGTQTEWYIIR